MSQLKNILLLLASFLFSSLCMAQKETIQERDALFHRQNLALWALQDTAKIDCLNELSHAYVNKQKKDSALYYATAAFEEANTINYMHGIAASLYCKAEIAIHFEADFAKTEKLAKESLRWYESISNKTGMDELYILLWTTMFAQSKYDEAIEFAKKRYEWLKRSGENKGVWDALHMLSIVYKEAGDYEKSFYYNRQAYERAVQDNNPFLPLSIFIFGELYMEIGDYPTALNNFRRAFLLDNQQSKNNRIWSGWDIWVKMEFAEVFTLLNQFDSAWYYYTLFKPETEIYNRVYLVSTGECLFLQKNYTIALQNFLEGLRAHTKLNDRNQIMRTLLDIAKTYKELGNDSVALQYCRNGLEIALNTKAKQFIRDGYQILYSIYDHWKQTDSANFYFRKYSAMKDVVANDQIKAKFAAYMYDQQIELLNKEKQLQQEHLRQSVMQKKFLIIIVAGVLMVASILFRTIALKRKNEAIRREIAENELQLQKLESEKTKAEFQQQATELEMQVLRAQMNPHFIFNSLNSINRFILQNNKLQASAYLIKFSKLVRLILKNSQSALITLENELEALQLYLELEVIRFDQQFTFNIKTDPELDVAALKVPPLIIQPYAENAIWHGLMHKEEKGHLEIELFGQDDIICCKITDNGIGRIKAEELKSRADPQYKSMGMRITADRIAMLQQKKQLDTYIKITDLVLADGSSGGTEVLLKIPL